VRKDVDYIADIVLSKDVDTVVLGMPYHLDGTIGKRAKDTEFFAKVLRKVLPIPVVYADERLTSVEAEQKLHQARVPVGKHKQLVDQVAAQIILQQYLDSHLARG
jgi:putative Holliday junction resolvase